MKLFHRKKRKFYTYLLSYLIFGVLSLFLSIFGYINCEKAVKEEVLSSQTYVLSQLLNSYDFYISTTVNMNQFLSNNGSINYLMDYDCFNINQLLVINDLMNELNRYKNSVDFCSELAIYFYKSDSFVTNNRHYSTELSSQYPETFQLSKTEFLDYIDIPDHQGYQIIETSKDNYSIFFFQNVYSLNYTDKLATIINIIPWEKISDKIVASSDGGIYSINKINQILTQPNNKVQLDQFTYDDFINENELFYSKIGDTKYISSYKQSHFFDLKYCMTMPQNNYFKQLNYMKLVIFMQLTIILLITIISIYYFLNSYHPIAKIISIFRRYHKISDDPIYLNNIGDSLENLLEENFSLSNSWNKAKEDLSNQVFSGFIKGWNYDIDLLNETILTKDSISLKEEPYISLIISYQNISNCKLENSTKEEAETYKLLQYIFRNVFNEKILSKYTGLLCEIDGLPVCIINVSGEGHNDTNLTDDINDCIKWFLETLNLKVFISGSSIYKDFVSLPKAYNEASQVLSYQIFWGNELESLIFYDEVSTTDYTEDSNGSNFLDNEKKLHNLIVNREYEIAYILLNNIIDKIFIKDVKYMEINQCRMSSLVNTLFTCLSDNFEKNDILFFQELQPMKRMLEANSIKKAKYIMKDIFDEVIDHMKNSDIEDQPKWLTDVTNYVNDHYTDANLNISILADKLDMNLSYVGRTYKKYMGYGLTDYIHMQRLMECKRRLELGESVKEAAEAVGYLDSKTLIRIFKKQEGITPGQFKNICEAKKYLS